MSRRIDRLVVSLGEREAQRGGPASSAPIEFVRAPGRVNLMGEHTDYNDGFVLPVAIDLEVWVAFRPHDGTAVELTSLEFDATASFAFDDLAPRDGRPLSWIDYVGGMAWALREDGLPVRGFVGVLDSTVPVGAGLSSSAALEMAAAQAFLGPAAATLPPGRLAALGRRVENRYVGVSTGIMDQFASMAGRAGHAILLDCRSLEMRHVPLPPGLAVVACDTASPHRLEASQYNARRADCDEAVRILFAHEPSIRSLRDVDGAILARHRGLLPERIGRRCEHVVDENARVGATVEALEAGDLDAVRRLFAASHASMRDLYEISSPELDALVDIAMETEGVVAARMTGGGFGGCTVNLVRDDAVDAFRDAVLREYPRRTGLHPKVYVTRAVDGAGPMAEPGS